MSKDSAQKTLSEDNLSSSESRENASRTVDHPYDPLTIC